MLWTGGLAQSICLWELAKFGTSRKCEVKYSLGLLPAHRLSRGALAPPWPPFSLIFKAHVLLELKVGAKLHPGKYKRARVGLDTKVSTFSVL